MLFTLVMLLALLAGCASSGDYRQRAMLSALDQQIDPCEDFYQYACGGWLDQVSLPPDQSLWRRSFSALQRNNLRAVEAIIVEAQTRPAGHHNDALIADFFAACVNDRPDNHERLIPLAAAIAQAQQIETSADAFHLAGALHSTLSAPLIAAAVWPDFAEPDRYMLHIAQSGLSLPTPQYYANPDSQRRQAFRAMMVRLSDALGPPFASLDVDGVIAFESALAERFTPLAYQRDAARAYNPVDEGQLDEPTLRLVRAYLAGMGLPEQPLPPLNITSPNYLDDLIDLVEQTPPAVLRDYFLWRIADDHRVLLNARARRIAFDFYGTELQGVSRPAQRRHECIVMTHQALGEAVGERFIDAHFSADEREAAERMMENLRLTMIDALHQFDWMAEADRQIAIEKARAMHFKVGYPRQWLDYTSLQLGNRYLLANVLSVRAWEHELQKRQFFEPVNRDDWALDVFNVNAYYNATANEVVVPAGILQAPLFERDAPPVLNLSAIGSMMAHEISHGFDANGSLFDQRGALHGGWQVETQQAFDQGSACLVDHFEQVAMQTGQDHSPGSFDVLLTLQENRADLMGLEMAFQTYLQQPPDGAPPGELMAALGLQSEAQLFFVSFAQSWCSLEREASADLASRVDPHASAALRVNGAVAGVPGFATSFSCPLGTPMHPRRRCELP